MRLLQRYVLREHIGPFFFAATALTSLMLLQYIARQFGNLVGKGLGWRIILEFFVLSIPFTVAMTLPMAVLVSVLYAFSRLGSENEITAIKAGGVSTRSLMNTVILFAMLLALGMVAFNDQVMPRTNHRLATLQMDIVRTKPTFALREQVINEIQPERLYLSALHIDEATQKLRDVTIYDVADPTRRRTIFADSGRIELAKNERDIVMTLHHGYIVSIPTAKRGELDRLYFTVDNIRIREVASQFQQTKAEGTMKGDREMTVCEMQTQYEQAHGEWQKAKLDLDEAKWRNTGALGPKPKVKGLEKPGGIGASYCEFIDWARVQVARFRPKKAEAADMTGRRKAEGGIGDSFASPSAGPPSAFRLPPSLRLPLSVAPPHQDAKPPELVQPSIDVSIYEAELDRARLRRDRYGIEIQKKFSLAAACVVLAFVGAPIALRFPRGGVGLVIGVSFTIFGLYYVCLIMGESLANKGYVAPFWAMWAANIVFGIVGIALYSRMGHESSSTRGDDLRDRLARLFRRAEPGAASQGA